MSSLSRIIVPLSTGNTPAIEFNSVDFPAPLLPTIVIYGNIFIWCTFVKYLF
jgi:hypothetical protein